jgi:hypothetical protein
MLRPRHLLSAPAVLTLLSFSLAQQPCVPAKLADLPLQLGQLAVKRPVDACACTGAPKGAAGSAIRIANNLQNSSKNNFQASGPPKSISVHDMIRLQEKVDEFTIDELPRGDRFTLPSPTQRKLLRNISLGGGKTFSEGDMVTLAGFVIGARHSNVSSGESVNCGELGCANNDIHIEVTPRPRDTDVSKDEQMNEEGVDVEISPRHRPDAWETFDSPDYRAFLRDHPVMFTGQLFYDASHSPGGGPARASVWEVHPVYAIWVCRNTSAQACPMNKQDDESVWLPFHKLKGFLKLTTVRPTTQCQNNP